MKLIHIAHRGEAQEFLKVLKLKANQNISGIYSNDKIVLVISGEGIPETISKISYAISKYNILEILNFGIAGTLDKSIDVNSIVQIRTVYKFEDGRPKFKSFTTCSTGKKYIDCITTNQRVLDDKFADTLSNFAHTVDRELWGVGFCAKTFNLPFRSYKLISDMAGSSTECFDLKERALEFSSKLCEHYMNLEDKNKDFKDEFIFPVIMSFSNKVKFKKLIDNIVLKENLSPKQILLQIEVDEVINSKLRPKEKAALIISKLEQKLNPINTIAAKQMINATDPFRQIGAKIKFDKDLESKKFEVSMEINSQTNLNNLKRAIEIFDYNKVEKLWAGEFDV